MNYTVAQIIHELEQLGNKENIAFKERKFGVKTTNALGIYHPDLKIIAKKIGKDSRLAKALFETGIYEAKILCSQLFDPRELTEDLMEKWVPTFENWEICDSFCMGLFAKSQFAVVKAKLWSQRSAEFEKRASFATIAAYCMADKKALNPVFEQFFPLIKRAATDERIYVKKAVNWALRNIGKRNLDLNQRAIEESLKIYALDSPSAQWIAKDALKKLQKPTVKMLDYPRSLYRL
ncbi:DNA alkylation repair protein [Aureispira anguillae]|uniref:DNA alkylation repair protein n=1 Tax=Aureispira anguillae TaxID=2864201 RepID=A0A915YAT3_9BACT|nr:DNA alkylation repair protein [Aureispira anguillae]BDS09601.1 DNA alkylation repair protein [Aureispira anguillae]